MTLELLEKEYAVCRLEAPVLPAGEFVSLTMSGGEVSLVCEAAAAPPGGIAETGWRGLRVAGVLDFALIGILAGLTDTLAKAGVSVFAVSTYDTDYLFVRARSLDAAIQALKAAGHEVTGLS
jgi:hypothetical protein